MRAELPGGLVECNGTCIDPNADRSYRGASDDCQGANAGTACAIGEGCLNGTCKPFVRHPFGVAYVSEWSVNAGSIGVN